jgi:hypothetical protein
MLGKPKLIKATFLLLYHNLQASIESLKVPRRLFFCTELLLYLHFNAFERVLKLVIAVSWSFIDISKVIIRILILRLNLY